jgi:hypothetical protein
MISPLPHTERLHRNEMSHKSKKESNKCTNDRKCSTMDANIDRIRLLRESILCCYHIMGTQQLQTLLQLPTQCKDRA